jgi:galactokinase
MTHAAVHDRRMNIDGIRRRFRERFGATPQLFRAPGRVNLIGEHTDYNDGFVMPAAIDFYTWVAASVRADATLHVWSEQFQQLIEIPLHGTEGPPQGHWSDYVRGMAGVLQAAGYKLRGADVLIDGQVPIGAGLSSSAALELSVGLALLGVAEIELPRLELVKLSQNAEHKYAGALCGIMDQFIAGYANAGNAILLDCRSLKYELLPVSEHARLVICNSMVKHDHAAGEYNTRRAECATAVRFLRSFYSEVRALRDVRLEMLASHRTDIPDVVFRRAFHVVTENERVTTAAKALQCNQLDEFGKLMYASHNGLRDDYEVSCEELDLLVELAAKNEGVYGARMTGGGFGGCTVNLVQAEFVEEFRHSVADSYERETKKRPDIFVCSPAEGAGQVKIEVAH